MYHSLDVVYDYPFTIERESHSVQDIHFFVILSLILSQLELSRTGLPKLTTKFFNGNI